MGSVRSAEAISRLAEFIKASAFPESSIQRARKECDETSQSTCREITRAFASLANDAAVAAILMACLSRARPRTVWRERNSAGNKVTIHDLNLLQRWNQLLGRLCRNLNCMLITTASAERIHSGRFFEPTSSPVEMAFEFLHTLYVRNKLRTLRKKLPTCGAFIFFSLFHKLFGKYMVVGGIGFYGSRWQSCAFFRRSGESLDDNFFIWIMNILNESFASRLNMFFVKNRSFYFKPVIKLFFPCKYA